MEAKEIHKAWCFFEQSGTFKNEFIKLGIPAVDLDIQNNFGQTDYVIDLFAEIENAYDGKPSIFDEIGKDDLIIAFFPCIYFEAMQANYYRVVGCNNLSFLPTKENIIQLLKGLRSVNNITSYFINSFAYAKSKI